jgi:hypothetical protein
MKTVILWFLQSKMGGGTTTYTAHLYKALEMAGAHVILARIKNGRQLTEPFGEYSISIYNFPRDVARWYTKKCPSILTAVGQDKMDVRELLINGARAVLHDATQLDYFYVSQLHRPICIRQAMWEQIDKAVFIPHPYMRMCENYEVGWQDRKVHAISLARVHTQKRSLMLVKANEQLPAKKRIKLLGKEFRLYSYGLQKRYPHYKQSGKQLQFALNFGSAPRLALDAIYNVDMSWFENDGGGTQYSQLEAMDAGCVNVMHEDWFRVKGTLPKNAVITVNSVEELVDLLEGDRPGDVLDAVRSRGYEMLEKHAPERIGNLYLKELEK